MFVIRVPLHGSASTRPALDGARGRRAFGGLSDGLRLLLHLCFLRRQGQGPQFLQGRPRDVRCALRHRGAFAFLGVLPARRELPAASRSRDAVAQSNARTQQVVGALRLLVGTRHRAVLDRNIGGVGRVLGLDRAGITGVGLPEARKGRHDRHGPAPSSTALRPSDPPSSACPITQPKTYAMKSSMRSRTRRISISSCCTRPCREHLCTREAWRKIPFSPRFHTPTATDNSNSTFGIQTLGETNPSCSSIGLFVAITKETVPASADSSRPCSPAGGDIPSTPIRGCVAAFAERS